ncbi:ABC transporter ATP-binding protein [Bacillus sp. KH172YL63]|uniref:ABC transporter ATP-binding protein n=1 Tax=Bacillus sp. KH172YL63 TaxID=2709784 RepID=UPI0013E4F26E|nr:ABC transporter ATP-binding protein [Bacillus sp. KH172YL63]BCB02413.1 ABC transporter [Bacillus sp. KH172YL63]
MLYIKKVSFILFSSAKGWLFARILSSLILGLVPYVSLWTTENLVNGIVKVLSDDATINDLFIYLIALLFVQALPLIFGSLIVIIDKKYENILNLHIQHKVSYKATNVPISYYDIPDFHNKLSRLDGNLGLRLMTPVKSYIEIFKYTLSILSVVYYLIEIHWALVVLNCVVSIPLIFMQNRYGKKQFNLMVKQTPDIRMSRYYNSLLSNRQSIREVRIFGLRDYFLNKWSQLFRKTNDEAYKLTRSLEGNQAFFQFLNSIFYVISLVFAIYVLKSRSLGVGAYVAITQSMTTFLVNIKMLGVNISKIYKEQLYIKDLFDFLDYTEGISTERATKEFTQTASKGIEFKNVDFKYPLSDKNVLKEINFSLKPNEKIAIVGSNGSGKSTLVKCLMGLYHPTKGEIFIDGLEIREIKEESLYKKITVIFQDFIKYNLSIYENIAIGNIQDINNEEKIQKVAKATGIHNLAMQLDDGYQAVLGKIYVKGVDLSGGQWQNLALSRALFKEGEIFILDEPTSALDPKAELEVFEKFKELSKGKTTIYISHRMASARLADRILVMDKGRIIEEGTHDELMIQEGTYFNMYSAQAKWYQ